MTKTLFVFVFLFGLSFSVHADDVKAKVESSNVSFNYYNRNSAYSCDFAKAKLAIYAQTLGAELSNVKCYGGIQTETPTSNWRNIRLTADLNSLTYAEESDKEVVLAKLSDVTLKGRDACDFSVSLIEHLLTKVDHELVKKSSSCWDSRGNYNYSVKTLTAN